MRTERKRGCVRRMSGDEWLLNEMDLVRDKTDSECFRCEIYLTRRRDCLWEISRTIEGDLETYIYPF